MGNVFAEGPSMILEVKDAWSDERDLSSMSDSMMETLWFDLKVDIIGIGVSIVDQQKDFPEELVYLSLKNIAFDYIKTNMNSTVIFSVSNMQIDNQRHYPYFPIILYSSPSNQFITLNIIKSNLYHSFTFIKLFSLNFQEMDIKIDDELLLRSFDVFTAFFNEEESNTLSDKKESLFILSQQSDSSNLSVLNSSTLDFENLSSNTFVGNHSINSFIIEKNNNSLTENQSIESLIIENNTTPSNNDNIWMGLEPKKKSFIIPSNQVKSSMLYFEEIYISEIRASVTFLNTKYADEYPEETSLASLLQTIGTMANFENAPLKFNSFEKKTYFLSQNELTSGISNHYYSSVIGEISKIVGYSDILGNPLALLDNVGEGVKDFVSGIKPGNFRNIFIFHF